MVQFVIKQEKGREVVRDNTEHLQRKSSNLLHGDKGDFSVLCECVGVNVYV